MKYLYCGDTHGDLEFAAKAAEFAKAHDVDEIIQVGDWGYLWPRQDKVVELAAILEHYGVPMRFLDGNHDDHPRLFKADLPDMLRYQRRGSLHTDRDGTRFLFLGGAPSIDRAMRTPGRSWWAEETITEEDMVHASSHAAADVVVTHDAPDYPPGFRPLGDPEFRQQSTQSMNNVRSLLRQYSPALHVHGHWHHRYRSGVTLGLDCNTAKFFQDALFVWEASVEAV